MDNNFQIKAHLNVGGGGGDEYDYLHEVCVGPPAGLSQSLPATTKGDVYMHTPKFKYFLFQL